MYAGRVAVSFGEYADGTDGQTDGWTDVTVCFPLGSANVIAKRGTTLEAGDQKKRFCIDC